MPVPRSPATERRPGGLAFFSIKAWSASLGVFGSPLGGILSTSGNLTFGTVTSIMGAENDSAHFQFSAPVQPGNSGGAVTDSYASVIGVVSAQLRPLRSDNNTLVVPQNVNFAIKSEIARTFLGANAIEFHETGVRGTIDRSQLTSRLMGASVPIECYR